MAKKSRSTHGNYESKKGGKLESRNNGGITNEMSYRKSHHLNFHNLLTGHLATNSSMDYSVGNSFTHTSGYCCIGDQAFNTLVFDRHS